MQNTNKKEETETEQITRCLAEMVQEGLVQAEDQDGETYFSLTEEGIKSHLEALKIR